MGSRPVYCILRRAAFASTFVALLLGAALNAGLYVYMMLVALSVEGWESPQVMALVFFVHILGFGALLVSLVVYQFWLYMRTIGWPRESPDTDSVEQTRLYRDAMCTDTSKSTRPRSMIDYANAHGMFTVYSMASDKEAKSVALPLSLVCAALDSKRPDLQDAGAFLPVNRPTETVTLNLLWPQHALWTGMWAGLICMLAAFLGSLEPWKISSYEFSTADSTAIAGNYFPVAIACAIIICAAFAIHALTSIRTTISLLPDKARVTCKSGAFYSKTGVIESIQVHDNTLSLRLGESHRKKATLSLNDGEHSLPLAIVFLLLISRYPELSVGCIESSA